jgi:hypothetical protein
VCVRVRVRVCVTRRYVCTQRYHAPMCVRTDVEPSVTAINSLNAISGCACACRVIDRGFHKIHYLSARRVVGGLEDG